MEDLTLEDLKRCRQDEIDALVSAYNERNQDQVVVRLRNAAQIDQRVSVLENFKPLQPSFTAVDLKDA
ncbi:MAG TPA: hypothetical protein VNX88_12910 [Terriglobales bacterium]|nr:hypothetical protein [Terriglobales bacterium]